MSEQFTTGQESMPDLEYVLRFALHTIEEHNLQDTQSAENWKLGEAIEEQLVKVETSVSDEPSRVWKS